MTATEAPQASILEQVRSAPASEKRAILNVLLEEWAKSPNPAPLAPLGPAKVDANGVFTPWYMAELRRRIENLDDSSDLQVFVDSLGETEAERPT